jgi:hypothetical protein
MLDKTSTFVRVVLCVTFAARAASAQEATDAAGPTPGADGPIQLNLPRGRVVLDAYAEINLSSGAVFEPFSLAPDVWYGATDEITVGLVHSTKAASGFIGAVGDSLCLTGAEGGCADFYRGFGLEGRYPVKLSQLVAAVTGGVYARNLSPFQLAIKLGMVGRWQKDKLAVELSPNLFFGLTNRAPGAVGMEVFAGNQEVLNLPVTGLYTVAPKIDAALQTGLVLPFQSTGDGYAVPLSIGAHYHVNESLNVNAAFTLPALIGGGSQTGFDARTFTLGGTYAF